MSKVIPILFSGPMVRANLEGRKSVTRRVVKPQPINDQTAPFLDAHSQKWAWYGEDDAIRGPLVTHRFGHPGDLLMVRETVCRTDYEFAYRADIRRTADGKLDPESERCRVELGYKWTPSIHMPKAACRLVLRRTLPVTVERVESITEEGAKAEGFNSRADFLHLFYDVNERAEKGSNPWVWVIPYEVAAKTHAEAQALMADALKGATACASGAALPLPAGRGSVDGGDA